MRFFTKFSFFAVAVMAIGLFSSAARANDLLSGGFTLSQPTRWNDALLPAGRYQFRLIRSNSDSNILLVQGAKQSFTALVYTPSICKTCGSGSLNLSTRGTNPVVTSMDLAGAHVNFNIRQSAREREEQLAKNRSQSQKPTEQMVVHSDPNN